MNTANLNTLIQRYEDNFEWINNAEHDEIFKWRAVRCFQDVWFSEEVEDMTFAEKFKAATKECSVLLDNGQVSPTNGIVKMAEQEPDEVERLFVEVLFADDQGNLQLRQDHVEEFLDGIEAVRERTFPSYWKYGQNRHCAFTYLALYAPEENYIYKYSEAEEFAKHIEYGIDIGSGQTFKLSAYYGMCDLVVDALRTRPALLEKHWAICGDECYHDDSLHLLAFDVIYCSRAYNFYQGIYYIPKSESTSAYNKEQLRLKEEAKVQERIDSLETQIQAKDIELDKFRSISLLNVRVTHKQYGTGIVIAQKENTIKVRFPEGLEKSFIIHTKFPARPTFEDDEQVVETFTEYDRLTREIQGLKKLLEIEKAKVQTTIL